MSATPGHPALRARISEALERFLADHSARSVGERLGHAGSTIDRRSSNLGNWPADELLHLAAKDHALGLAVRDYLTGDPLTGDARNVNRALYEGLSALGKTIAATAEALSDQNCDPREAARLLPLVQEAQVQLAQAAKDLAEQIKRGHLCA